MESDYCCELEIWSAETVESASSDRVLLVCLPVALDCVVVLVAVVVKLVPSDAVGCREAMGVGEGVGDRLGVAKAVGVDAAVGFGVKVGFAVGAAVGLGVSVTVGFGVEDGFGVGDAVGLGVKVGVGDGLGVAVGILGTVGKIVCLAVLNRNGPKDFIQPNLVSSSR